MSEIAIAQPRIGRLLTAQLRRDLTVAFRSPGEMINPLVFYLVAVTLFPFGVGPGVERNAAIAAGVLWVLALLATLLALDSLFRRDYDDGTLEQLALHADPLFVGVLAKVLAHWLLTGLPLTVFAPLGALMLHLDPAAMPTLVVTLLLGTPILSVIGAVGAALTVGLRRGAALLALIVLPLYIPVLILGAGAVTARLDGLDPTPQIVWLAALLTFALTAAPFAAAQGLRVGLE